MSSSSSITPFVTSVSLAITFLLLAYAASEARDIVKTAPEAASSGKEVTKRTSRNMEMDQSLKTVYAESNEVLHQARPRRSSAENTEMGRSVSFLYPKGNGVIFKDPSRVFDVSVHEVPSGPNPISNR